MLLCVLINSYAKPIKRMLVHMCVHVCPQNVLADLHTIAHRASDD